MTEDEQKQAAAAKAVDYIEDGMVLGLGTGSCAAKMVDLLGKKVAHGLYVTGVPTSEATAAQARALGIPIVGLDEVSVIDLTIDGTDEVDPEGRLIKGGGGAHLREKIVASLSDRMIVIAEAKKKVPQLGAFKLPVEVIRFAWARTGRPSSPTRATTSMTAPLAKSTIRRGLPSPSAPCRAWWNTGFSSALPTLS